MLSCIKIYCICIFFLLIEVAHAQLPIFLMQPHQNVTVTDCKGEFHDSDAGPNNNYLAQASDTFHICTGGTITMNFQQFQLENGFDTIFFYDGPSINNSALLGKFTGSNTPTGIVANGCLTIYFKSSFALQDLGWVAKWTSTVIPPVPPTLTFTPPLCNTSTIDIQLNKKIKCDSVYASAFTVTGPVTTTVTNANATTCSNDSTTNLHLQLSQPLNKNCTYIVAFTVNLPDNCDSIWTFTVNNSFTITDCPITLSLAATPNDTICSGTCVELKAILNSCLTYNYNWSNGLSNAAIQNVCPTTTTTYTLGVQSTSGGPTFTSSITITVLNPHITPPTSDTVCQSIAPFNLTALPAGGIWHGQGITDTINGTFDPDTAMQGQHIIHYTTNGFCVDSFAITVLPMDAGLNAAACPGSAPFQLNGFYPSGGTWSGYQGITSAGVFTPDSLGVFTVTYTHSNGCSDTTQVYVQPLVITNTTDSLCQSDAYDTIAVSPPGGRWIVAAGIIDTVYGVLNPRLAGGGMHDFYYQLHGCIDTAHIYIKPVDAGYDIAYCPLQSTQTITTASPAGGVWNSIGTNNGGTTGLTSISGDYNPNVQGITNFVDTLVYTAINGCTDTIETYVLLTNIIDDSLFFCMNDDSIILDWSTTRNYPGGGTWTGSGISYNGSDYYFNPATAGVGVHVLVYDANTCSDTMYIFVYPNQLHYNDTTICTIHPVFMLDSIGINATWQGAGITDSTTGVFDPSVSGIGTFPIVYSNPAGCTDTINVTVYQFATAQISGLDSAYCFKNHSYPITLTPANGNLSGNGITGNNFNPSTAGAGTHQLIYTFGSGLCFTSDTFMVTVYPPIVTSITASDSSICKGGGSTLTATVTGGNPAAISYSYAWSNGLFPTNTNVVSPANTTTYTLIASDGCSDDVSDSITISVFSSFYPQFTLSPIGCNGNAASASVNVIGSGSYSYQWSTTPVQTSSSMDGLAGSTYNITIVESPSGCSFDSTITLPGYGIIHALFSENPNLSCIPFEHNTVTFIDLSLGATQGFWELSNGITIPYTVGENPEHTFTESGNYTMKLHVENAGNCSDEFEKQICILEPEVIFVPDIFSPNGDGVNDILYARVKSVKNFSFSVYDRWGEKVFETNNTNNGWNGTYNGKQAEQGVYMWYLTATLSDGTVQNLKGDLSLVR